MSGVRTVKIADGLKHEYVTQNGRVVRETVTNASTGAFQYALDFTYDEAGHPLTMRKYNNADMEHNYITMHYVCNAQGDVMKLIYSDGTVYASYSYDAWGNVLTATENGSYNYAALNPLRYRGYYYDTETGFYYLQSRYYDPALGRFLNADSYASTGQGFLGYNMFAYCANNPVMFGDWSGTKIYTSPWEDQTDSGTGSVSAMMAALGYNKEPFYEDVVLNDCHAGVSTESFSKSGRGRIAGPSFSSTTYDYKIYTVDRNPPGSTVIQVRNLFPYRNINQYFNSYSGNAVSICGHKVDAHGKVIVYAGFENGTMVCVELLHFVTKESSFITGIEQELEGYMTNASSLGDAGFAGTGCGGGYNGFLRIDR